MQGIYITRTEYPDGFKKFSIWENKSDADAHVKEQQQFDNKTRVFNDGFYQFGSVVVIQEP